MTLTIARSRAERRRPTVIIASTIRSGSHPHCSPNGSPFSLRRSFPAQFIGPDRTPPRHRRFRPRRTVACDRRGRPVRRSLPRCCRTPSARPSASSPAIAAEYRRVATRLLQAIAILRRVPTVLAALLADRPPSRRRSRAIHADHLDGAPPSSNTKLRRSRPASRRGYGLHPRREILPNISSSIVVDRRSDSPTPYLPSQHWRSSAWCGAARRTGAHRPTTGSVRSPGGRCSFRHWQFESGHRSLLLADVIRERRPGWRAIADADGPAISLSYRSSTRAAVDGQLSVDAGEQLASSNRERKHRRVGDRPVTPSSATITGRMELAGTGRRTRRQRCESGGATTSRWCTRSRRPRSIQRCVGPQIAEVARQGR